MVCIKKFKPSWYFIQNTYANVKHASSYPKFEFGYIPRRAYFLILTPLTLSYYLRTLSRTLQLAVEAEREKLGSNSQL